MQKSLLDSGTMQGPAETSLMQQFWKKKMIQMLKQTMIWASSRARDHERIWNCEASRVQRQQTSPQNVQEESITYKLLQHQAFVLSLHLALSYLLSDYNTSCDGSRLQRSGTHCDPPS
jgi:hypothetical protein